MVWEKSNVFLILAIVLLCGAILFVTGAGTIEVDDTAMRTFTAAEVRKISLRSSNGAMEVLAHSGNDIKIEIIREARSFSQELAERLLEQILIQAEQSQEAVEVAVIPPQMALGKSRVHFKAYVPATWQGQLELSTSNGSIDVYGLQGEGVFHTSNGSIGINEWHGSLQVTTSNGQIEADHLRLTGASTLRTSNGSLVLYLTELAANLTLRTSNGRIGLSVPSDLKADVVGSTRNGTVSVVSVDGSIQSVSKTYNTQLNGGGPPVDMHTSNGHIEVDIWPVMGRSPAM